MNVLMFIYSKSGRRTFLSSSHCSSDYFHFNSAYFHVMFARGMKDSNQKMIEHKDENISAAALKIVLDSISSGVTFKSTMKMSLTYLSQPITFKLQVYVYVCKSLVKHGKSSVKLKLKTKTNYNCFT